MKWFKHISVSGDDPDIDDAITLFGSDGYYVFFRTLEIMSREFDIKNPGVVTFSWEFFRKRFRLSARKLVKVLSFFDERQRIKVSFSNDKKLKDVTLKCLKLKELCDEYTRKKIEKCQDSVRTPVRTKSRTETDTDTETDVLTSLKQQRQDQNGHYSNRVGSFLEAIDERCRSYMSLSDSNSQGAKKINIFQFVQHCANSNIHPEAIVEAVDSTIRNWSGVRNSWTYLEKTVNLISQNKHGREHEAESQAFKEAFALDERLQSLVKGIGK